MSIEPRLDIVGAALADPSRVRILCELMDGRSHTGKELACVAGVAPSTASEHLSKLLSAKMVVAEKSGRCTYYRIANAETAEILEQLSALSPSDHLYRGRGDAPELLARTCYNHIAGRLGVLLAHEMIGRGWVEIEGVSARWTATGIAQMHRQGIVPADQPMPLIKCCLDWSERRHHFSGPFGTILLNHALSQNWVRRAKHGRALIVEPKGLAAFERFFGITQTALFDAVRAD